MQQPPENQPAWLVLNDSDLADAAYDVLSAIETRERDHRTALEPMRLDYEAMAYELARRIRQNGGYALPHADLQITLRTKEVLRKRIDVLRKLEGLVPDDELRPALSLDATAGVSRRSFAWGCTTCRSVRRV